MSCYLTYIGDHGAYVAAFDDSDQFHVGHSAQGVQVAVILTSAEARLLAEAIIARLDAASGAKARVVA